MIRKVSWPRESRERTVPALGVLVCLIGPVADERRRTGLMGRPTNADTTTHIIKTAASNGGGSGARVSTARARLPDARQRITVLLVEQDAYHALRLAHRGYVMQTGRITLTGTGHERLANPEVRAAYLEGGRH